MTAATGTEGAICGSLGEEGTPTSCVAENVWDAPSAFGATEVETVGVPGAGAATGAGASRGIDAGGDIAGGAGSGEDVGAVACTLISCVRNNDEMGSRGAREG